MKNNINSKIFDMVEEELHSINKIKDISMTIREFNKIKYPAPKHYTSKDIVRLRRKLRISQAVLARFLNASESTIKKWEIGAKVPGGANCQLLRLLENQGLQIFFG
jgi:putative transcriptional regulator